MDNIVIEIIKKEYEENGINKNLIKLLNVLSKSLLKEDEKDPFWTIMAREMLETLIILNLVANDLSLTTLLEQSADINKARQICKENLNKIDILKLQAEANIRYAIKNLTGENNDKTLGSILEMVNDALKIYDRSEIQKDEDDTLKDENKLEDKTIEMSCPFCNNEFKLNWDIPAEEKTFYCRCPNCNAELKRANPFYKEIPNEKIKDNKEEMDKNMNLEKDNELGEYTLKIEGIPNFKFYFPKKLGVYSKTSDNVFELLDGDIKKIRVMISKCDSEEKLEADAKRWIEKNKISAQMEDVSYRKEKIADIPIEVYELKFINGKGFANKIYKIGYFEGCRITISGAKNKGREEIINQAFVKLKDNYNKQLEKAKYDITLQIKNNSLNKQNEENVKYYNDDELGKIRYIEENDEVKIMDNIKIGNHIVESVTMAFEEEGYTLEYFNDNIENYFENLKYVIKIQDKILKSLYNATLELCKDWEEVDNNGNSITLEYVKSHISIDFLEIYSDSAKIQASIYKEEDEENDLEALLGGHFIEGFIGPDENEIDWELS